MRNDWLERRLRELKAKGKTKSGLAKALKLPPARITDLLAGERTLSAAEIRPVADYLEWPAQIVLSYVTGGRVQEIPLNWVMVVGAIEPGVWREGLTWPHQKWYPSPLAPDQRYKHLRQFALEARGRANDELYPQGSIVLCVKLSDLGKKPRSGERVIVERRSASGVEIIARELRHDEDNGLELWPQTADPSLQKPRKPRAVRHDTSIEIAALVIGSYQPEG